MVSAALVAVYDRYDDDVKLLGPTYNGLDTDWTRLTSSLAWLAGPVPLGAAALAVAGFVLAREFASVPRDILSEDA